MLNLQVLVLTLIPLFSGVLPTEGGLAVSPLTLLGREEVSREFVVGVWKYSDEFFRWGVTDKDRTRVKPFRGSSFMVLRSDGTMSMVNLFRPKEGRWELTPRGILIFDPRYPERGTQVLPVRKRGQDRIWILLPFSGGAAGIGMARVSEQELERNAERPDKTTRRPSRPSREISDGAKQTETPETTDFRDIMPSDPKEGFYR